MNVGMIVTVGVTERTGTNRLNKDRPEETLSEQCRNRNAQETHRANRLAKKVAASRHALAAV